MITASGTTIARGTRISNHLYRLNDFTIPRFTATVPTHPTNIHHTFATVEPAKSWKVWHCRFGHLGISSIQTLVNKSLVTGLNVNLQTPKYDCNACTQAKQHVTPASTKTHTKPGKLTHTNLWGKYPIQSINGNLYFHSFLDDSTKQP